MTFRIHSISIDSGQYFSLPSISLGRKPNTTKNFFSVIIGNNGTGKSRLLASIVDIFRDLTEGKRRTRISYHIKYEINGETYEAGREAYERTTLHTDQITPSKNQNTNTRNRTSKYIKNQGEAINLNPSKIGPKKLIAITSGISDKFPVDNYHRPGENNYSNTNEYSVFGEDFYTYLGPRTRVNSSSGRVLMDKALDIMLGNISKKKSATQYGCIFDYLNYLPAITLKYELISTKRFSDFIQTEKNNLKFFIQNRLEKESIRFNSTTLKKSLQSFSDEYWQKLTNLCREIYLSNKLGKHSIFIDFSEDKTIDNSIQQEYELLNTLRRLEIIKGPSISLHHKNGGEFDFSDASSGESGILSTLMALVPIIEDNSLIVIDEPEISLHPFWQSKYIALLDKLLSAKIGCHIVIATHSHFLVSDLPIGRSEVISFKNSSGISPTISYIKENTFGWSAENILLNVFDMPTTRNFYLSEEISEALELMSEGKKNTTKYNLLVNRFKDYLPAMKTSDPLRQVLLTLIEQGQKKDG